MSVCFAAVNLGGEEHSLPPNSLLKQNAKIATPITQVKRMNIDDFSTAEQEFLPRALAYWVAHWDWECPTLFGLEQTEFQMVIDSWPDSLTLHEYIAALALIGALRELLYGASAVKSERFHALFGIGHSEAESTLSRLLPRAKHVLG